ESGVDVLRTTAACSGQTHAGLIGGVNDDVLPDREVGRGRGRAIERVAAAGLRAASAGGKDCCTAEKQEGQGFPGHNGRLRGCEIGRLEFQQDKKPQQLLTISVAAGTFTRCPTPTGCPLCASGPTDWSRWSRRRVVPGTS